MRIGINGRFYAARLTGVQRFARELCNALYHRTETVLFLPADADVSNLPADLRVVRGTARGHIWEQLELPRRAAAEDLHALLHPANTVPRAGDRNAVVVHDVLPLTEPHWFSSRYVLWHRHVVRPAIARARTVFTCSQWSADQIIQSCGVAPGHLGVITQGLAPFDAPARSDAVAMVRERFGIAGRYLLCVGAGDARKNVLLIAKAVAEVRRTHPDLMLVAVGANDPRIHQQVARDANADWIRSVGSIDDDSLRALYTGATALCFPSLAEGFGRPPLEALACGTPAIAGDYGAAREVLGDSVPILPHEPAPWVALVRELLERPATRVELVSRGTPRLSQFSWERAADQLLSALAFDTPRAPVVFAS